MGAIGLAMHLMGLKWRTLPYSHNYDINWRSLCLYKPNEFRAARIIHYHDSMFPYFWDTFLQRVQTSHPQVAKWLLDLGPMRNEASYVRRAWSKALRTFRNRKERTLHQFLSLGVNYRIISYNPAFLRARPNSIDTPNNTIVRGENSDPSIIGVL